MACHRQSLDISHNEKRVQFNIRWYYLTQNFTKNHGKNYYQYFTFYKTSKMYFFSVLQNYEISYLIFF